MKLKKLILVITASLLISCDNANEGKEKWIEKTIKSNKFALEQTKCKILTLNVQSKNIISDVDAYFIWNEFSVLIDRQIGLSREDSCYYEAMKQIIIKNKGEEIVDTISSKTEDLTKKPAIDALRYFDGVYSHLLNARLIDGEGAKIINEENYYKTLDSVGFSINENMSEGFLSFWVTIDTTGSLEKIELINDQCQKIISEKIVNSFETFKWKPATFNGDAVKYRFRESIFISSKTYNQ